MSGIEALRLKVQNGEITTPRTIDFAWSLIRQFDKNGALSEKQMEWVEKITTAVPGGPHPGIDFIKINLDSIKPGEKDFVLSLIEQWNARGYFSAKQDWWVSKISGEIFSKRGGLEPDPNRPVVEPAPTNRLIVEANSDAHVVVELRPQVWAVIDTTTNTILGTFDDEAAAQHSVQP